MSDRDKIDGKKIKLKTLILKSFKNHLNKPGKRGGSIPRNFNANSTEYTPEIYFTAHDIILNRRKKEPAITNIVKNFARNSGGKPIGLTFRLKGVDSLARKIQTELFEAKNAGKTPLEMGNKMGDVIRYTIQYNNDNLVNETHNFFRTMESNGYTLHKASNYFGDGLTYNGMNTQFRTKDGTIFEVQFHTRDTLIRKDKGHKMYEESRLLDETQTERKEELDRQMIDLWKDYKKPKNWENLPGDKIKPRRK